MASESVFGLKLHPGRGDERLFQAGPMEPGVHLRWAFRNDMGFPPGGFRLWRRPFVGGGEFGFYLDEAAEDAWEHLADVDLPTRLDGTFPDAEAEREAAIAEALDRLPRGGRDLSPYEAGAPSLIDTLRKITRSRRPGELPGHLRRLRGNGGAPRLDLAAQDLVLTAAVDPYLARMVGLYHVDGELSYRSYPWWPADYAVEGFWGSTPWPFRRVGAEDVVPEELVTGDFGLGPLRATTTRRSGLRVVSPTSGESGLALFFSGGGTLPLHLHFPVEIRDLELRVVRESGMPEWSADAFSADGRLIPVAVAEDADSVRVTAASSYPFPGFRRIALYDHRGRRDHHSTWLVLEAAFREFREPIGDRRAEALWSRNDDGTAVLDPRRPLLRPVPETFRVGSRPPTLAEDGEVRPTPTVSVNARAPDADRGEMTPVRMEVRRAGGPREGRDSGGGPPGGDAPGGGGGPSGGGVGPGTIPIPAPPAIDPALLPPAIRPGLPIPFPLYRLLTIRDGVPAPVLLADPLPAEGGGSAETAEGGELEPADYLDVGVSDGTYRYQVRGVDLFGRVSSWSGEREVEVVDRDPPPPPSGVEARYLPLEGELVSGAEDAEPAGDGRPRFLLRVRLDGDPTLPVDPDGRVSALVRYDLHVQATRDGTDLEGALTIGDARMDGDTLVTLVRRPPFLPFRPHSGDRARLRFDRRLEVSWTRSGRHRVFFPGTREFRVYVEEGPVGAIVGRVREDGVSAGGDADTFEVETDMVLPGIRTRTVPEVTHEWTEAAWDPPTDDAPVFIAALQGYAGSNPAAVRVRDLGPGTARLKVEEEASSDPETSHVEEVVGIAALPAGPVRDLTGRRIGVAGRIRLDQPSRDRWHRISFSEDETVTDPVVLTQLCSFDGTQPAHVRVRNVGPRGFDLRIEEWDYLDGIHVEETISWVALEKGAHPIGDGSVLEVDTAEVDHRWSPVDLDVPFDSSPTVLSTVQTFRGIHPVVTRHRRVDVGGFELRLQEEEGLDTFHLIEKVGFAVVATVEETHLPGRPCQVGDSVYEIVGTDESTGRLTLDLRYAARPVVEPGAGKEIRIEVPGGREVSRDLSDPAKWADRVGHAPVEEAERVSGAVESTTPVDPSEIDGLREAGARIPAGDPPLARVIFATSGSVPGDPDPATFVAGALVARDSGAPERPWRAFDVLWHENVGGSRIELLVRAPAEAESDEPSLPASGSARYVPGSRHRLEVEAPPAFREGAGTSELLVGVSAADGQRRTEDLRGVPERYGNEGAVSPRVTVMAVDRTRPPRPPTPTATIHRADVEGRAVATVRWDVRPDTLPGTRYRLHRTTDEALRSWDVRQRRLRRGPYDSGRVADPRGVVTVDSGSSDGGFPVDPDFQEWIAARFPDHTEDWPSFLFAGRPDGTPAEREAWKAATPIWRAWAGRFYPTLEDFEVQALAGIPGSEGAFALVTETPVAPAPGAGEVVHEDRVGGRVENRYLYRVEAVAPSLQSAEEWSGASSPTSARPSRRPPHPVLSGVRAVDAGVVLRWTLPGAPAVASYFVYRASSAEELGDLRWFGEGGDPRLAREVPDPRLRADRRGSGCVLVLPRWLELDDPESITVRGVYSLRHFDRTRWPPDDQPRALDLRRSGEGTAVQADPGGGWSIPLKPVGERTPVTAVIQDGTGALRIVDRLPAPEPLRVRYGTVTLPRRVRVGTVLGVYEAHAFDWSRSSPDDQPSAANALRADAELRIEGGRTVVDGVSLPEEEPVVVVASHVDGGLRVVDREQDSPTGRYVDRDLSGTTDRFYRLVSVDVHGLRSEPSKIARARPLEITPPEPPEVELDRTSVSATEDRIRLTVTTGRPELELTVEWRTLGATVWQPAAPWTTPSADGTATVDLTVESWEERELRVWSRTPSGLPCSRPPIYMSLPETAGSP